MFALSRFIMEHPLCFTAVVISLLQVSFQYRQQTFYIKPENSSQCPANVSRLYCKDLATFVLESQPLLSKNTSLLFLPGHHYLKSTLIIANVEEFAVAVYNDSAGMRKDTLSSIRIACLAYAGPSVHIENVSFVRIDSISFHQCGSLLLRSIQYSIIAEGIWNKSRNSAIVVEISSTTITNCQIIDTLCYLGCGVRAKQSNVTFTGYVDIQNNRIKNRSSISSCGGGGLYSVKSHILIDGSVRVVKNEAVQHGGGMCILNGSLSSTYSSCLVIDENIAHFGDGGGLYLKDASVRLAGSLTLTNNSAARWGGAVYGDYSKCSITGYTLFHNNTVHGSSDNAVIVPLGGALFMKGGNIIMTTVDFSQNAVKDGDGGAVILIGTNFTVLMGATFINNTAGWSGGAIAALGPCYEGDGVYDCSINFTGNVFFANNTAIDKGGAIQIQSRVKTSFLSSVTFTHNSAREGGAVQLLTSSKLVCGSKATFTNNVAWYSGGSVSATSYSYVTFLSELNVTGSQAGWAGGGISLTDANMVINGKTIMEENNAGSFGGVIFAERSNIIFLESSLISDNNAEYGGAMHVVNSDLDFTGSHRFLYNSGRFGGGWSFVGNTFVTCSGKFKTSMTFEDNYAGQYGGAIWIEDTTFYSCINYEKYPARDCFFKNIISGFKLPVYIPTGVNCKITTRNNTAMIAGSIVHGGNVDTCKLQSQIYRKSQSGIVFNEIFHSININESILSSPVSSNPTRVCFCQENSKPNCSTLHFSIEVYSGERFGLSVVGVGQRNATIPTVIVAESDPPSHQSVQIVSGKCSMVYYTAVSRINLVLYPENVCKSHFNLVRVSVNIKPCPPGFEKHRVTQSCTCEATMKQIGVQCDITSQSFTHAHGVWVSFSQPQLNSNQSSVLIFHHSHCPLNYCSNKMVNITCNSTDKQCRHGRQGHLCGACVTGYSLTLGGSKCTQCSYHYLFLFVIFAVAGVALVVFLITLGLTVSAGTMNGLIFFANVIGTNYTVFIPPEDASILTVFISWLNLDLGINTCLFPGLDMYTEVWLQFAFPLYLWVLIGIIIVASHRSVQITGWLGGDPVSVLATLILLSYTKLLRTILTALSFTYIQVSDGSRFAVWLYDGNLQYLSGKHIPLFLFVLLVFLLLFLPYTSTLLVSPYLQPYSEKRFLSWIDDRRLKHFLRSYYAPLKDKRRSWIGLLLAVRFSLLLVFVSNSLGDPSINLVAITITTFLIVGFKTLCGTVYTNWCLDVLDLFFEIKLGLFSVLTLYVIKVNGNQSILSNTFLSVSFLVFLAIVLYHIQKRVVSSRWWKYSLKPKCKKCLSRDVDDSSTAEGGQVGEQYYEQNVYRIAMVPEAPDQLRESLLDSTCT